MIMPNANRKLSHSLLNTKVVKGALKLAASVVRLAPFLTRIRAAAARESHKLQVTGSNPVSASILVCSILEHTTRNLSAVFPSFSFARLRSGFFCGVACGIAT